MKLKKILAVQIMLSAVMLASGCSDFGDSRDPSRVVVAEVNGETIRGDDFLYEYVAVKKRLKIAEPKNEELSRALKDRVLGKLIDHSLMLGEAKKAGIETSPNAYEKTVESLIKGFTPAKLKIALERNNQSFASWKETVYNNTLLENLIRSKVAPLIRIPEEEIKKYFDEHSSEFNIKERVHAYHIVLHTLSEADNLRNDIVFGADFEAMAKKYSVSPDGIKGGDLGMFAKGQMPLEFDNALFELKINQISKVVESPYGFHIFKVVEKFKPRAMQYSEAREIIFNRMFHERMERKFKEWLEDIRTNAKIVVYSERLYKL